MPPSATLRKQSLSLGSACWHPAISSGKCLLAASPPPLFQGWWPACLSRHGWAETRSPRLESPFAGALGSPGPYDREHGARPEHLGTSPMPVPLGASVCPFQRLVLFLPLPAFLSWGPPPSCFPLLGSSLKLKSGPCTRLQPQGSRPLGRAWAAPAWPSHVEWLAGSSPLWPLSTAHRAGPALPGHLGGGISVLTRGGWERPDTIVSYSRIP